MLLLLRDSTLHSSRTACALLSLLQGAGPCRAHLPQRGGLILRIPHHHGAGTSAARPRHRHSKCPCTCGSHSHSLWELPASSSPSPTREAQFAPLSLSASLRCVSLTSLRCAPAARPRAMALPLVHPNCPSVRPNCAPPYCSWTTTKAPPSCPHACNYPPYTRPRWATLAPWSCPSSPWRAASSTSQGCRCE